MRPSDISILGIGEDGVEGLGAAARALIGQAALVVGGARHLALAAPLIRGATMAWPSPMADAFETILGTRPAVVLASGDPFWFGVGASLAQRLPAGGFFCIPAPSAFSLACARLGWAVQDVEKISFCGRPLEALMPLLQPGRRMLALSAGAETPAEVARLLRARGFGASRLLVMEALGGPREKIFSVDTGFEGACDPLNMLAIEVVAEPGANVIPLTAGLADAAFEHDGQITKQEIRAVTLAALAPRRGEMLWDIGCGAGSVGIEWMLRDPANRAVGLECRADRAARAMRNALSLGVPAFDVRVGTAPEGLAGLPWPDAVFLGGGCDDAVLERAWAALPAGGRLVVNAVTVETASLLLHWHGRCGGRVIRIGIERLDSIGRMHGFRPAMAVTQWAATKQ